MHNRDGIGSCSLYVNNNHGEHGKISCYVSVRCINYKILP